MQERACRTRSLPVRDAPVRCALECLRALALRQRAPVRQPQFFRVAGYYSLGPRQMLEVLGVLHDEGLLATAAAASAEPVAPPPPPPPDPADPVAAFLAAADAAPRLTRAQELELARAVRRGRQVLLAAAGLPIPSEPARTLIDNGARAAWTLVRANLRLVPAIARFMSRRGQHGILADLMQEAVLGLLGAALAFDPERGYRFGTHATWRVRKAVSRYLERSGRVVRLPAPVGQELRRLVRLRARLASAGRLSPRQQTAQLARRLGLAEAQVVRLLELEPDVLSLDQETGGEGGETLGATLPATGMADRQVRERRELAETVASCLAAIGPRLRLVLELRFGLRGGCELSLEEVGQRLGITRERVRQLERKALEHLQRAGRGRRLQ